MNYYRYKTELIDQKINIMLYELFLYHYSKIPGIINLKREEVCFCSQFLKGCPWSVVLGHVGGRIAIAE